MLTPHTSQERIVRWWRDMVMLYLEDKEGVYEEIP